ncbi:MAG: glycosyltransferase family 2 protein [Thermoproteota archaeon]
MHDGPICRRFCRRCRRQAPFFGQTDKPASSHIVGRISPWGQFFTNFDAKQPREVEFLHGSNMSFRRDLIIRAKGLDPRYKTNWRDDTDLCIRIRKLGYKLIFQPAAVVWHKCVGSRTRFSSINKVYCYLWNREYFYYKNLFSLKKIPWTPIFAISEAIFYMTLYARYPMMRYIGKCLQGMRDGATEGLRVRCNSRKICLTIYSEY